MERIRKQIGNAEFDFWVNSRGTRSGFAHDCELYLDGMFIAQNTEHYLNRTWERYRFQTAMQHCVAKAIEQATKKIRQSEMDRNGWKRLTKDRKEQIQPLISENDGIKTLNALMKEVDEASYGTETERRELEALDCMLAVVELLYKH